MCIEMLKICSVFILIMDLPVYFLQDMNSCVSRRPALTRCNARHVPQTCRRFPWWSSNHVDHHCPPYHFHVPGLFGCHPWLNCSDLPFVTIHELVGVGAVKAVYRAQWNDINIAYSVLNNQQYLDDFQYGLNMLKLFSPNPFVVQLIGYCEEERVILTDYHEHGNAVNIITTISSQQNISLSLQKRLELCLNYARILEFLHNSPAGTRVFCDSNDLEKLLSQLLVTDNFTLVLNDLDALPEVNKENNFIIKCGHAQITGTFVAPEQLWHSEEPYDNTQMLGYNEKTDIWKSASVCNHFLGDAVKTNLLIQYHLVSLHESCRDRVPQNRPTATSLVKEYSKIVEILSN